MKKKRKPNFRQQAVIDKVSESIRNNRPIRSKGNILRSAGYPESIALHPDRVFDSPTVSGPISSVISEMQKKRDMALAAITPEKVAKASGMANAMTVDILTKNIELLSGRPTEITEGMKTDDQIFERILERSANGRERETIRIARRRKG